MNQNQWKIHHIPNKHQNPVMHGEPQYLAQPAVEIPEPSNQSSRDELFVSSMHKHAQADVQNHTILLCRRTPNSEEEALLGDQANLLTPQSEFRLRPPCGITVNLKWPSDRLGPGGFGGTPSLL